VEALKEQLDATDANNKAERERLLKEIAEKDRRQREEEQVRNAELQSLRDQIQRQKEDLDEERRRARTNGGGGGILGGEFPCTIL